jgi:hypothetical protein
MFKNRRKIGEQYHHDERIQWRFHESVVLLEVLGIRVPEVTGGLFDQVQKDPSQKGSSGGSPYSFDTERYKQRHAVE